MASIFLSYAREDAKKASALAKCLERAGHTVWWDRHIHGGSEFSGAIEAALRQSDVVLVLWTDASMRSAWVRDEAAEGRDSGRLVPVLAEDCTPPLGFRQHQTISIDGWSGRGNPPTFQQILASIAARLDREEHLAPTPRKPAAKNVLNRLAPLGLAVLVAVLLAVGAWWMLKGSRETSETPILAVLPFSDLSPKRDKAYFSEGVAEAILTVLAKERGIRVIGRSTAEQLHKAGPDSDRMRRALGVTHVLEGSARSAGDQLRMSVRLINASDGQQMWAEEYQRRIDNIFAVQDEIGRAVAQRLKGSFAGAADAQQLTNADAYALYLAARAKMRDRKLSNLKEAHALAERVLAADPKYAPGHAIFAELTWHLSVDGYGDVPTRRALPIAERHARKAIELAPQSADGYAALGLITSGPTDAAPLLRKAIALDPARAELRLWLGQTYNQLGRSEEALEQIKAAVEMEPLWGAAVSFYSLSLAGSERYREADAVVAKFEQRGGSPATGFRIRGDIAGRRGDFSEGVRLMRLALTRDPETPWADERLARFYYMLGFPDKAAAAGKALPLFSQLRYTGDHQRLMREARAAGPRLWDQENPGELIGVFASAGDWATIESLHDQRPDGIKTLCKGGYVESAINVANALEQRGRSTEAAEILACASDFLTLQSPRNVSSGRWALAWAQIHALEGRPKQAFALLERAIARGARTPYGRGLSDLPAFNAFRNLAEYRRLDARLKQLIVVERSEAH